MPFSHRFPNKGLNNMLTRLENRPKLGIKLVLLYQYQNWKVRRARDHDS